MIKKHHKVHKPLEKQDLKSLHNLAYDTILQLETPLGINASGKDGRYAAFFGRDSMITCLKLLHVYKREPDEIFLLIIKKTIATAVRLQGKEINLSSGEKPGKIIHEYRESGYAHLTSRQRPWYIYPDKTLRNYDSVDATPLFLILAAEFYSFSKDKEFLKKIMPHVEKAFEYLHEFSPKGGNRLFLEYQLHRPAPYGGLVNQGWMDSIDSILIYDEPPKESVALVEVQAYYFKALKLWAKIYERTDKERAKKYELRSRLLKSEFNTTLLMRSENLFYLAYAIFGHKAEILEVRSNPGHCLWAAVTTNGKYESIIEDKYISDVVTRLMKLDLFEPGAGIRTLSTKSKFFDPCSYHNGSIWPFDNGLIAEGFENFGYKKEAEKIKEAVLGAIRQFGTAVELYCTDKNGRVQEYSEKGGHYGTHQQAWTAATVLDFTT
ncbi:MAG: hypothetical protein A2Z11_00915 [Candidatus Woykebacteria bacterium RBG_16_43_9]|uniref:Mannosylglycerate hydrolase MGH1-like glycoside hydrolase domain-containing protein n=1 Tax=Candidatus Woykebacteria bacterium RBG_16_43_9 TaxID=1802596 RepID=A0A1G1WH83_9BACT|nr:MAG: hypothetical protein A2Z11_00915 [Candidatus Woykebacteria bacterium RBG_16_43_9]